MKSTKYYNVYFIALTFVYKQVDPFTRNKTPPLFLGNADNYLNSTQRPPVGGIQEERSLKLI